ncbi:MAG: transposase [Pseudomonadota bacterium]
MASDERVDAFLTRPIESGWHAPAGSNRWRLASASVNRHHLPEGASGRSHRTGRARRRACTDGAPGPPLAIGVNMVGPREVLGMAIGAIKAEPFRTEFLRDLVRRGLGGAKLAISDAHGGASRPRRRGFSPPPRSGVAYTSSATLSHRPAGVVPAFIATAFAQPDHTAASARWRRVADQMRRRLPKLATLME